MASCRSGEKKVVIARIKGGQGGKRRENSASGEDLACNSVWLAVTTAATATVRIHCTFLLTFQFFNYRQVGNGMQNQILLPFTLQTLMS